MLGFLTILFVLQGTGVVPETSLDASVPLGTLFLLGSVAYILLLITSRLTAYAWLFLAFLLGALALIHVYAVRVASSPSPSSLETIVTLEYVQAGVGITAALTTFFGFLIYIGEKKLKYRELFDYGTFMFGVGDGMGNGNKGDGSSATYAEALAAAFKGVGE